METAVTFATSDVDKLNSIKRFYKVFGCIYLFKKKTYLSLLK